MFSAFLPVVASMSRWVLGLFFVLLAGVIAFLASFFVTAKLNPLKLSPAIMEKLELKWKWHDLFRWILYDLLLKKTKSDRFTPYGLTVFVGPQGTGKTISMVNYLDRMKKKYPHAVIVANFGYSKADFTMLDWDDLLNIRNGEEGVIFAIDEIHSEYSSASSKDVPESLLSEVSQQRKQRIKIVASSQFFSRIAKPIREQTRDVVVCKTYFGRLTVNRRYDAYQYALVIDNPNAVKKRLRPLEKGSFVQSNRLREEYDTMEKIQRMRDRQERKRRSATQVFSQLFPPD